MKGIQTEQIMWCSVNHHQPQEGQRYLVQYKFGITQAAFFKGKWVLGTDLTTEVPGVSWFAHSPTGVESTAAEKSIAIIWTTSDVQNTCFGNHAIKLTDEQAYAILQQVDARQDANEGINWTVLDTHISMYLQDNDIQPDRNVLVEELMQVRKDWTMQDFEDAYDDEWTDFPETVEACRERMEEYITQTYDNTLIAECIQDESEM